MENLNKKDILGMSLKVEEISIPEWGGRRVRVREMTGAERDKYEADLVLSSGAKPADVLVNLRARLAVLTMVDEKGERLFIDADADKLGRQSGAALERVAEVAERLSLLSKKSLEELAENSEPSPGEGSA